MAQRKPRPRPSLLLLVLLLSAFAVGASVSLLVTARTAGPPPPVGPSTGLLLPSWLEPVVFVAFALAVVLPPIYFALRAERKGSALANRYIIGALSLLLAIMLAVVVLHLATPSGALVLPGAPGASINDTGTANNSTKPPSNASPAHGPGGLLSNLNLQLPSWFLFVVVLIALVGVTIAGVPPLREYLEDRRESRRLRFRAEEVRAQVQSALQKAVADLEGSLDPRTVILALYATLLARIEPLTTAIEQSTPEEIRFRHLTRLGIRPGAAVELTRAFEEARYSSHPLGPDQVGRARNAIRAAETDLARSGALP
jgi:hypothetical protein